MTRKKKVKISKFEKLLYILTIILMLTNSNFINNISQVIVFILLGFLIKNSYLLKIAIPL